MHSSKHWANTMNEWIKSRLYYKSKVGMFEDLTATKWKTVIFNFYVILLIDGFSNEINFNIIQGNQN